MIALAFVRYDSHFIPRKVVDSLEQELRDQVKDLVALSGRCALSDFVLESREIRDSEDFTTELIVWQEVADD